MDTTFNIGGESFSMRKHDIGNPPEGGHINPGMMNTGSVNEVLEFFKGDSLLFHGHFPQRSVKIPYGMLYQGAGGKVYGDYTTSRGQEEFANIRTVVRDSPYNHPGWAQKLKRFSELKQARKFSLDQELACLMGCREEDGRLVLDIGPGKFSAGFHTMGSQGISISLSEEEKIALAGKLMPEEMEELVTLSAELEEEYGERKTIREIIFSRCGGLAPFNMEAISFTIGVAGQVLTRDGKFVFALRGKNVSINRGINVTASGAIKWGRESLVRYGFQGCVAEGMHEESFEEIGLNGGDFFYGAMEKRLRLELGVRPSEYTLEPVGFFREYPRAGSPEMMFLIRFDGTVDDLIAKIASNQHPGKKEIERYCYSMPIEETERLIRAQGGDGVIQHKCVLNLATVIEYLRNCA